MYGGEGESLEKLYPFSMPAIKLGPAIEELECLMARVKNNSLGFEILTPMIQCPHYYIKFFVIG